MSTTPLVTAAALLFVPLIMRGLSYAFPPKPFPQPGEYEMLRARHKNTELSSLIIALGGVVGLGVLAFLRPPRNTPWLIGIIFGAVVITPVLFVVIRTLPKGVSYWREFWRFYEIHCRISLGFLGPLYLVIAVIGMISLIMYLVA